MCKRDQAVFIDDEVVVREEKGDSLKDYVE
jgi:hypothetical protein